MAALQDIARAKVNLTLHAGRAFSDGRFKGYHPLDSLVVFADFGDRLSLIPSDKPVFEVTGEFAQGLSVEGDNLINRALEATKARPHSISLNKVIPVSAGLGGGSANAAAVLRLFDPTGRVDDAAMGADIPVCRHSKTALMQGVGDRIKALPDLGQISAILVNPRKAVSTGAIFKAFDSETRDIEPIPNVARGSLLERALAGKNDLQAIAEILEPEISNIIRAIENASDCRLARMSGSGATCFGLYTSDEAAELAALTLAQSHPQWWVRACRLGDLS